jgi:hypothetical protein
MEARSDPDVMAKREICVFAGSRTSLLSAPQPVTVPTATLNHFIKGKIRSNYYPFLEAFATLRGAKKITSSVRLSVCINNSRIYISIFVKFCVGEFYEKLSNQFNFNLDRIILTTTLHNSINT